MICFLDMDGVIADFVTAACLAHGRISPYRDPANLGSFDMEKLWKMQINDFWKPINTVGFWHEIPLMPDAKEIVDLTEKYFGKEVAILTAPSHDPHCFIGKREWILRNFPQFENRLIFAAASAKRLMAGPGRFLIDDRDKNLDQFAEAGGTPICVPRPWNHLHGIKLSAVDYINRELDFHFAGTQRASELISGCESGCQISVGQADSGQGRPKYDLLGQLSYGNSIGLSFNKSMAGLGTLPFELTPRSDCGQAGGTQNAGVPEAEPTQLGDDVPF